MTVTVSNELMIVTECPECGEIEEIEVGFSYINWTENPPNQSNMMKCISCGKVWESGEWQLKPERKHDVK